MGSFFGIATHVDYQGQQLAENLFQLIIIAFSIIGFVWGYICQEISFTMYILLAGIVLACVLVLPPWPFYQRQPLPWLSRDD